MVVEMTVSNSPSQCLARQSGLTMKPVSSIKWYTQSALGGNNDRQVNRTIQLKGFGDIVRRSRNEYLC
jgi:hypothetical protein